MVPEGLQYTSEHEWVVDARGASSSGDAVVRIGITDYAQDQLGDVVFVQLPEVGATVSAGDPVSEVESTKSVSEIYAPLSGEVTAVNDALSENPELVNSDPYGSGWMLELRLDDRSDLDDLLDADGYQAVLDEQ